MQEVKARGGRIIAITSEGNRDLGRLVDHQIAVPASSPLLAPVLTVIPLQLLADHIAVLRGCDVDRPRNLAKSVTVERYHDSQHDRTPRGTHADGGCPA